MKRKPAQIELKRPRVLRLMSLSFFLAVFAGGITLLPDALFKVSAARKPTRSVRPNTGGP